MRACSCGCGHVVHVQRSQRMFLLSKRARSRLCFSLAAFRRGRHPRSPRPPKNAVLGLSRVAQPLRLPGLSVGLYHIHIAPVLLQHASHHMRSWPVLLNVVAAKGSATNGIARTGYENCTHVAAKGSATLTAACILTHQGRRPADTNST